MSILEASDFFSFDRISASNFRGSILRASLYDLGPIPESHGTKHNVAMRKLFTLLTSAACILAFLILAPAAPGQSQAAEEKVIALAQQLKLTPQQEVEVLPILKAEAPKFEAIKNDPSLSGMQKMKELHAIHSENAPQLQKILSPAQYQQLQAIREADIKKAIAGKRAGR
jgi:hypothetical protein